MESIVNQQLDIIMSTLRLNLNQGVFCTLSFGFVMSLLLMKFSSDALSARPFHGRKRLWVDPDRSNRFRTIKDLNGNTAFRYTSGTTVKMPINVKLQAGPEPQLVDMKPGDIVDKIKLVKKQMFELCEENDYTAICQTDFLFERFWEPFHNSADFPVDNITKSHSFSVMQFNILAEGLSSGPQAKMKFPLEAKSHSKTAISNPNEFGGFDKVIHPEICLNYDFRRWRILEVILGGVNTNTKEPNFPMSPDILGVEEIDNFHSFFLPVLAKVGYQGIFVPKRDSPCVKFGYYSDGCALFWRSSVFQLVSEERRQFQKRGQVYIIATLKHLESGELIVIGVTHLKAKKGRVNERDRTAQVDELLRETKKHAKSMHNDHHQIKQIPIIVMGDFNSEPNSEVSTCVPLVLNHGMVSAYPTNSIREFFTTLKSRGNDIAKRVIDYIFFNPRQICCTHTLNMPVENDIVDSWGLPGFSYPSDHIMIGAKFKI